MFPYVTVSLEISFLTFHGSSLPSFTLFLLLLLLVASSLAKEWRMAERWRKGKKRRKKVDPSLMPRRTGHGWNFKQRHVVELGISGLFCSIRP